MSPLEKSYALLQKYLKETPKHIIQKKIDELNQAHFEGVTIYEYFRLFEQHYWFSSPTIVEPISIPVIQPIWSYPVGKIVMVATLDKNLTYTQHLSNYNHAMAA